MVTIDEIAKRMNRRKEIYDSLSPELQKQVDEYHYRLMRCTTSEEIKALGENPMRPYLLKAGLIER